MLSTLGSAACAPAATSTAPEISASEAPHCFKRLAIAICPFGRVMKNKMITKKACKPRRICADSYKNGSTSAGWISTRRRVWPSGHSRLKHGAQGSGGRYVGSFLSQKTLACALKGGVCKGLEEPNSATWRTPKAAA